MDDALRHLWISYGADAVIGQFGPHGALLVCDGCAPPSRTVAPAGALLASMSALKAPATIAPQTSAVAPLRVLPVVDKGQPQSVQLVPRKSPPGDPKRVQAVRGETDVVGVPVGYPREVVNACVARLRAANVYALADRILHTEPFASAQRLAVGVGANGQPIYSGAGIPWDIERFDGLNAPWAPGERGQHAIAFARHYAAGILDGNARPRDMNPSWGDRVLERVPTHDRTAAWVNAWGRWAVDALVVALDEPSTHDAVAEGVLSICRGWQNIVY